MQHFKIKIELKSDLCAASGSGHGCYIDSDVCFDKFGFPYIPAKRLKGCLLDAANELIEWGCCDNKNICYTEEDKKRLFGEKGLNEGGSFSISNAYIENYREIYTMLDEMYSQSDSKAEDVNNQHDKEYSKNKNEEKVKIKRSDIINYFTSTRTRTAIDESSGTAKDGSLRTIRVINCIDPIKKEKYDNEKHNENNDKSNKKDINRVFIAEVSLSDPRDKELLNKCCKALRHIGSHRTRGFGAVKLSLEENNAIEKNEIKISDNCNKIKLLIRLDSPIMISSNKASESMDYIPGSTILGYFAGQYINKYKEADENFYKFFVNGQEDGLYFSNFYISDKNYSRYFPAPVTCKKEKTSEGVCYNSVFYKKDRKQNPSKSLTNKYIRDIDIYSFGKLPDSKSSKEDKCKNEYEIDKERFVEVKKEVFYHHARPVDDEDGKKSKDKAIDTFYQYNAISADQYFIGEIKGSKEGLKTIVDLLNINNCKMRIGKSKTAQYGSVTVVKYKEEKSDEIKISVNNGNELAVVAQSHIMLLDDFGGNIIKPEKIVKKIAEKLFGKEDAQKYCVNEKMSFIKVDQIGGYNRKWNLERPPVPAIAPGSVFTFIYSGDKKEINKYISIGERQNEGLGKMYVWVKDAVSNDNLALKEKDWISTSNKEKAKTPDLENVLSLLINNIKKRENLLKLKKKALNNAERLNTNSEKIDNQQKLSINSTTINNLLIKYMNGWNYSEFVRHVNSIKDTTKREEVKKLLFEDIDDNSSNKNSSNNSIDNASKNVVDSENEKAVSNSNSNNIENAKNKINEIKIYIEKEFLKDLKQESNSNAKEELLEYYLKYYYINLLTQCRLNIRINGNEKGGEKNDK